MRRPEKSLQNMIVQMSSLPLPSSDACRHRLLESAYLAALLLDTLICTQPQQQARQTWIEFGKGYQLGSQPLLTPGQLAHLLSAAVVRLFRLLGSVLGFVALCLLPAIKVSPNAFAFVDGRASSTR